MPKSRPGHGRHRSRTAALLLVPAAVLLLLGCNRVAVRADPVGSPAASGRPVVLATFTVLADIATVVAGPDAQVESITGVGMEIHGYEPTPDDLRRAAGADLLLVNGLGLEAWLEDLVAPLDLPTVVVTDGIDPLPIAARPDRMSAAEAEAEPPGPGQPLNPHAWMSPAVGRQYVAAVVDALTDLDPTHAAGYTERAEAYSRELAQVQNELVERLAVIPADHAVLVSCEGAFAYLARDAGLDQIYLWPVNAERQGTPRQVAAAIVAVRERAVPAVFCESTVSATGQRQVARETGARFGGTLYVDSLSGPDGPVPTYLDLLRHDLDVIVAGLSGEAER